MEPEADGQAPSKRARVREGLEVKPFVIVVRRRPPSTLDNSNQRGNDKEEALESETAVKMEGVEKEEGNESEMNGLTNEDCDTKKDSLCELDVQLDRLSLMPNSLRGGSAPPESGEMSGLEMDMETDRRFSAEACGISEADESMFADVMTCAVSGGDLEICSLGPRDLICLNHGMWLNDEVINTFMKLLQQQDTERRFMTPQIACHMFNSFFLSQLMTNDFKDVKRWTSPKRLEKWGQASLCILDCQLIFFPYFSHSHWSLIVADLASDTITHYDSLIGESKSKRPTGNIRKAMKAICQYFIAEAEDKCHEDWKTRGFEFLVAQDIPQQSNGFDCGVFLIQFVKHLSRGLPLDFSQSHVHYYRIQMLKELHEARILY